MRLNYQSPEALAPVIEAMLFASDEPIPAQDLRSLILGEEIEARVPVEAENTPETSEPLPFPVLTSPDEIPVAAGSESMPEIESNGAPKKRARRKQQIELSTVHAAVALLNENYDGSGR